MAKAALGKGLSALMGNALAVPEPALERGESIRQVERNKIVPSPLQPRKTFRAAELQEMVDSIRERGVIQPLIVREIAGKFELIAGERRWRASEEAGVKTLPVIVRQASDREDASTRTDRKSPARRPESHRGGGSLRAADEGFFAHAGRGCQAGGEGEGRCRQLGTPARVASAGEVTWVGSGDLSVGHAKVLLGLATESEQIRAATKIRKDSLSVRAAERLIESMRAGTKRPRRSSPSAVAGNAAFTTISKNGCSSISARAPKFRARPKPERSKSTIFRLPTWSGFCGFYSCPRRKRSARRPGAEIAPTSRH